MSDFIWFNVQYSVNVVYSVQQGTKINIIVTCTIKKVVGTYIAYLSFGYF